MGFSVLIDGKPVRLRERLPLLPLRDIVVFPGATLPIFVGRPASTASIEKVIADRSADTRKLVFAVAQRHPEISEPRQDDLYALGVVARLRQWLRLPDGTMRVLIEGLDRAYLRQLHGESMPRLAECDPGPPEGRVTAVTLGLLQEAREAFLEYSRLRRRLPDESLLDGPPGESAIAASYRIAAHLLLRVAQRQELLEAPTVTKRLRLLNGFLASELEVARLERKIEGQAQRQANSSLPRPEARVPDLRSGSMLGGRPPRRRASADDPEAGAEIEDLRAAVRKAGMPAAVEERANRELDRLTRMAFLSPEATVVRNYIDWFLALPWNRQSPDRISIQEAEKLLNEDHYGLAPVKERILEHIAVIQLSREVRGPVLCLVGPPGVGKTSLGRSVARALNRHFVRMSLGGVRDEAEIRGHRRTYVGSMPGRIIQAMRRAGTVNPVILLDEVDKLGMDYRGDPAAALLEVLDPEQNSAFNDHYLEVDYDLSKVLFVTTANTTSGIPPALQDRMEIIRLPGYLETEKLAIAGSFLVPKQRRASGLAEEDLVITEAALDRLIREYTREAGVRGLEREVASLCRKAARRKVAAKTSGSSDPESAEVEADGAATRVTIGPDEVESLLGIPRFSEETLERRDRVGLSTGLAWSEAGGTILQIEVGVLPGRGKLLLTGKLGATMRESAQAALSCVRARAAELGLPTHFYRTVDIHVHVPAGEVPKDGPSAGTAIALAIASALTRTPTRESVALTGELTLRGQVLPVGGLTEKAVAAARSGVRTVLIPQGNRRAISEIPEAIRGGLRFVFVRSIDEVLRHGLVRRRESGRVETASWDLTATTKLPANGTRSRASVGRILAIPRVAVNGK